MTMSFHNNIVNFCKPMYIGFAVLETSKTLVYDYHYNTMKRHLNDIELMYTDTDSLIYHVSTDDFYLDLKNKPGLLECMDTPSLPQNHPCYTSARKRVPGLFSDETSGHLNSEFFALKAKSYACILDRQEIIKDKGVRGNVVKNHLSFKNHKACLFSTDEGDHNPYRENVSIR